MESDNPEATCPVLTGEAIKLMIAGRIHLAGRRGTFEVRRGMLVISQDGQQAGQVAALAVQPARRRVVCLVLGHLPPDGSYQIFPASWVQRLSGEALYLSVPIASIASLRDWHLLPPHAY